MGTLNRGFGVFGKFGESAQKGEMKFGNSVGLTFLKFRLVRPWSAGRIIPHFFAFVKGFLKKIFTQIFKIYHIEICTT